MLAGIKMPHTAVEMKKANKYKNFDHWRTWKYLPYHIKLLSQGLIIETFYFWSMQLDSNPIFKIKKIKKDVLFRMYPPNSCILSMFYSSFGNVRKCVKMEDR